MTSFLTSFVITLTITAGLMRLCDIMTTLWAMWRIKMLAFTRLVWWWTAVVMVMATVVMTLYTMWLMRMMATIIRMMVVIWAVVENYIGRKLHKC